MTGKLVSPLDLHADAWRIVEKSMLHEAVLNRFYAVQPDGPPRRDDGAELLDIKDDWAGGTLMSGVHPELARELVDDANAAWCRTVAAELERRADELAPRNGPRPAFVKRQQVEREAGW